MSITKKITNKKFRRYFSEIPRTVYLPIALLIIVLIDKIIDGLKSRRCYLAGF